MKSLTVRRKLQLGVFALIGVVVAVALLLVSIALGRHEDNTAALRDMAAQLDHYRRTEGEAMYVAVTVATDDVHLAELVSKGDVSTITREFEPAASDIDHAVDLDFQLILAPDGRVLAQHDTPPAVAAAGRDLRAFHDAMNDVSVRDDVEYIGGEAFQIAAEPFYTPGGEHNARTTEGVLVVGRKLSSLLKEFMGEGQNAGTIVALVHDGRIFAASAPPQEWATLEQAIAARVSGRYSLTSINGVSYDLFFRDIDACAGGCTRVAQVNIFRSRAAIEAERRDRLIEVVMLLGGTAILAALGGWLLSRFITRPIEQYVEATRALAAGGGDLSRRLDDRTDDELGRLAKNLNEVFGQIGALAAKVKGRAQEVGAASEEIRTASRALLDGAAEQASRIQSTGAATTEMSASIQQVATSAADANSVAQRSSIAVEDAVRRMEQIREAVDRAAQRMALLGETGKRIGTIVDTIHTIADQTSLLALNAAIEAAHAGEHGRGFTVVADAVGQLATRVDRSAKEIDELIGQIRAQTEGALSAMADGKREVELGTKLIADSIAGIKQVLHVFDDTTAAVKEQAIASDEIARNMEAVGRIAQEVLVTSRQAVAQGDRLTTIANTLEEAVAGFRLDGDDAGHSGKSDRPLLRA